MRRMFFFGYGSLVNPATHSHTPCLPAQVTGWHRAWVATPHRDLCYLSAVHDPGGRIDGAIAPVPDADWSALDEREAAYDRHDATPQVTHLTEAESIAIYAVPPEHARAPQDHNPILLSYLDTVIAGFLQLHGRKGAEAFFDETTGWQAPVLNDRAAPRYSRTTTISEEAAEIVDSGLDRMRSRIVIA